jgi:hypothetical protein
MKVWTADEVKYELAEAYRVLRALPDLYKMRSARGYWPDITYEVGEVMEMRAQVIAEGVRPRIQPTSRQIRHMEIVLLGEGARSGWIKEHMSDVPALKRTLVAAALWDASDTQFRTGCRRNGWSFSTTYWRLEKAATLLADRLTAAGVELP